VHKQLEEVETVWKKRVETFTTAIQKLVGTYEDIPGQEG
jgi:hypothetical protein